MAKTELPQDLKEFLRLLNDRGVEYLIVGGYAVSFHGYPRATQDIDIWIDSDAPSIDRLAGALRMFGFDLPELDRWAASPTRILRLGYPPVRIELMTSISGVSFSEASPGAVTAKLDGVNTRIIGLGALRQSKRAAGGPKDLADLENLLEDDRPA